MTTPLIKPLTREVLVAGTAYRVTLAADQMTLTRKGGRKGITLTWEEVLAANEHARPAGPPQHGESTSMAPKLPPRAVLTEIAQELRAAAASLSRADESITRAGALPSSLMAEATGDPLYGRAEQRDHWFVEPLLTLAEVASILRVSPRAVRRLPMASVVVARETRFLRSVVRDYLRELVKPSTPRARYR